MPSLYICIYIHVYMYIYTYIHAFIYMRSAFSLRCSFIGACSLSLYILYKDICVFVCIYTYISVHTLGILSEILLRRCLLSVYLLYYIQQRSSNHPNIFLFLRAARSTLRPLSARSVPSCKRWRRWRRWRKRSSSTTSTTQVLYVVLSCFCTRP